MGVSLVCASAPARRCLPQDEEPPDNAPVRCHGCKKQLCPRCRVLWHTGLVSPSTLHGAWGKYATALVGRRGEETGEGHSSVDKQATSKPTTTS